MTAPPALADLFLAHRAFRAEARALATALTGITPVSVERVRLLRQALHRHHRFEEDAVLPLLAARAPGVRVDLLDRLVADHSEVEGAVRALEAELRARSAPPPQVVAAAARLAALVDCHLDDEERLVVPAWTHLDATDDRRLVRRARRSFGWHRRRRIEALFAAHRSPAETAAWRATAGPMARVAAVAATRRFRRRVRTRIR